MRSASLVMVALTVLVAGGCAGRGSGGFNVGLLVQLAEPVRGRALYVGNSVCRACHETAYTRWRTSGHAREFAGLAPADRLVPACLRCHVTGYGDPLGYAAAGLAPDLAAVGCETCHGPGADHARSAHPSLVPTATGGDCPPCEINRICRLCHTPEHSRGFDLARALGRVSCRGEASGSR